MPRPRKNEDKKLNDIKEASAKSGRGRKKELSTVTGMKDILPQDQIYWQKVRSVAQKTANDYGYGFLETPILEQTDLFVRGVGKQTDIVEKEMFAFIDQGGDDLCLRPEATASAVRAYIQHGMLNQPQPVRFFYSGPMFRHEKPQSGRSRQFYQFGFEAIGETHPALDAQLILMGWSCLNELGLEATVQVNSIGCPDCREKYKAELVKYYKSKTKHLCENCKKRLLKNPMRLLDCKEEGCRSLRDEAPQILDYLDEDCKKHFMKVLEYLDEVNLPYMVNPYIVRGLDYYTRTIFEFWSIDDNNGRSALGGGGRYDGLVEILGGREATPACGLAIGVDRVVAKMRENNITVAEEQYDVFVAQLGEPAKKKAMALYERLRRIPDVRPAQAFYKDNLKSQLEIANKLKVKFTLILGQKEIGDGTILLRDMDGGIQEVIDFTKTEEEIKIRIEKHRKNKIVSLGVEGEEDHLDKKLRRKHQEEDGMQENDQENEVIEAEERFDDMGEREDHF